MGYNVLQEMHGSKWERELRLVEIIRQRSVMERQALSDLLQQRFGFSPIYVHQPASNWQGAQKATPSDLQCSNCQTNGSIWCLFRDSGSVDHYFFSVHICFSCGNQETAEAFGGSAGYGDQDSFPGCQFEACNNTWLNDGDL